jgi:glycosyltransferase involved in cell wall biosynthesis
VENYIAAAIDSLLNQSEKFDEIIIVDDGSTDATAALLAQYRNSAGVKVFRTANMGQGSARNFALSRATGDYVYFFDADDLLTPDFVVSMQAVVGRRTDIDIIFFSGKSFLEEGCASAYLPDYDRKIDLEFPTGIDATGFLLRGDAYFASPCLYLSKRVLWGGAGLAFLSIVHEDEEIIMRLSCSAGVSVCLSNVFFMRRVRPASTMTLPKSSRNAAGYLRTMESIASYCNGNRTRVAPIMGELARRFYFIWCGYFAICKTIGARPDYQKVIALLIALGRLPSCRQLYEIWVPPALHARFSSIRQKICG